jgi:hypothetical protein
LRAAWDDRLGVDADEKGENVPQLLLTFKPAP